MKVGTPDNIHIVIFIDNSIVKAERCEFDLRASKNDKDKLTISLDGLSNLDTYLIKAMTSFRLIQVFHNYVLR